jgi:hypothetical protein
MLCSPAPASPYARCRYAEGLVEAVDFMSRLGVPMYITETGVADAGDERRPVMIQTYMEQVGLPCGAGRGSAGL